MPLHIATLSAEYTAAILLRELSGMQVTARLFL